MYPFIVRKKEEGDLRLEFHLSDKELLRLKGVDQNGDGFLIEDEFNHSLDAVQKWVREQIIVSNCHPQKSEVRFHSFYADNPIFVAEIDFKCSDLRTLKIEYRLAAQMPYPFFKTIKVLKDEKIVHTFENNNLEFIEIK